MAGNSAQYVIDIAATMSGGEQTSAELDRLSETLMGSGKGAAQFQVAIKSLSDQLSAAQTVSASAAQALADGRMEYASLEKAALQAARAVARAAAKGPVSPQLQSDLDAAKSALDRYSVTMRGLEDDADRAASAEKALAGQLGNVRKLSAHVDRSLAGQAESLAKVQGALSSVGGPVGRLGQLLIAPQKGFADLSQVMGSANATALIAAAGLGILVAAVAALTAAVVVGAVKVASWAVGLADSARSAGLAREAVEALNPGIAALRGEIDATSALTGQSSASLRALAKSLQDAKVSAADMPAALRAAAMAESALGQGGAQQFIDSIREGKVAVSKLAAETQAKLGGVVARQMLGLDAQSNRFRSNIAALFGGLNIDPVLGGMQTLVALFDKTEASGRAVEFLFTKIFQPLIDQAQNAAYVVEAFALGFLIGLTKIYIAAKPVIAAVSELFGFDDTSLADVLTLAKNAGELFAKAFVVVATIITGVIALFGAITAVAMAFEGAIFAVIAAVATLSAKLLGALGQALTAVRGYFASINWSEIGTNIMLGIARGITGAAGAVLSAIGGAVNAAIGKAKAMLGIASPSKVFAEIGDYTGQGFAVGVEGQQEAAQSAMASLVEPPTSALQSVDAGAAAAAPVAASVAEAAAPAVTLPTKPSTSLDLHGATFNFYGVKDAEDAERSFGEMLTRLLEGDASQLGAEVAPV